MNLDLNNNRYNKEYFL